MLKAFLIWTGVTVVGAILGALVMFVSEALKRRKLNKPKPYWREFP